RRERNCFRSLRPLEASMKQQGSPLASRLGCICDWDQLASKARYNAPQLASLCQVSIRQLERFFRHAFATSPQAWLNHLRLCVAQELLLEGLTVKETTYRLGFKQPSHFCRQ